MDRTMIAFTAERAGFNVRAVGVAVDAGHVLVTRAEPSGHVTLPGGRVELMESSRAGAAREMREELGVEVAVGRLLWVVENLFTTDDGDQHALEFYYAITLPATLGPTVSSFTHHEQIDGRAWPQTFLWLPVATVTEEELYPIFLRRALRTLPATTVHVVNDERPVGDD